jgi:hypothetical protein
VRHVDRYPPEALAQHKTRLRPYAMQGHCADYLPLPEQAADVTHGRL